VSDPVDTQHIRGNNTINVNAPKTTGNHSPRNNQFGVIYAMSTPKQVTNAIPTITQDDKEANCIIDNRPQTYANNIRSNLLQFCAPAAMAHDAVYAFLGSTMLDDSTHFVHNTMMPTWQPYTQMPTMAVEEVANGVVHPTTKETITKYQKLINGPLLRDVWMRAMCKELGRLAKGYKDTKGTDTIKFMSLDKIS
jgi:hypothetical protein